MYGPAVKSHPLPERRDAAPGRGSLEVMAGLDPQRIAAAGLEVLDERGAEGLTIRAIADRLGVTPMAIYHHVENKAALVALMVDRTMRDHHLPSPGGLDWKDDLVALARWLRESMMAHPGVSLLRQDYNVWTPSSLALGEHWVNLWLRSGLDFKDAVRAALASSLAVSGVVRQELLLQKFRPPDAASLSWLPNLRALFEDVPDRGSTFELVMRSLIDGLHSNLLDVAKELPVRELRSVRPDTPERSTPAAKASRKGGSKRQARQTR
jgi:AcrR family transcriptional regulator